MREIKIKISSKDGIHMRPAMQISDKANEFDSAIIIRKDNTNESAEAESILQVSMLAIEDGTSITITACGSDEDEAIEGMEKVMRCDFHEQLGAEK